MALGAQLIDSGGYLNTLRGGYIIPREGADNGGLLGIYLVCLNHNFKKPGYSIVIDGCKLLHSRATFSNVYAWIGTNIWLELLFGSSSSFQSNQDANIALTMYIPTAILIHILLRTAISSVVSNFVASGLSKWNPLAWAHCAYVHMNIFVIQ